MDAANGGLNMAEIDWNAPTVAPKAGAFKVYRTRGGSELSVSCDNPQGSVPFFGDGTYRWYYPDGSVRGDGIPHADDLIAIIPAPDSVEPDATQESGVVVVESLGYEIRAPETEEMNETTYSVTRDLWATFTIKDHEDGGKIDASPAAAIAIARAILRMAGESK
jgi:hypothetical protein